MASVIDLDRVRRNDDRLSTLQLILSGAVDLQALKEVLRVNTKVSEVIIYVDESFLVELPVEETHDLFRTIGGMPNLQKLGFHSQSGSSGVLSIQALIAITSHATRMVHFGISDVALWGSQADFQLWATQLQTQLFLQSFCVCECELLEPSKTCPLDPLLTVLSILPSLEALFLQAATPNALGQISPEAVGAIGMAPQLQDLRLGNFELKHPHMEQMAQVLPSNTVLTELKLDACHEFKLETAHAMARILKNNRRLKSLELGLTQMMKDDCAVALAKSLHYNTTLESFTLSKGANARFRPTISKPCQAAFVEMLHQNYKLETLVLFQRFPVKKEFKLYLTLNKYGRGKLLMNHETEREDWIQAIHKVNDDLDSIFYYLSINPSLCNHCFDEEVEEEVPEETAAAAGLSNEVADLYNDPNLCLNNLLYGSLPAGAATSRAKRPRGHNSLVACSFLEQSAKRLRATSPSSPGGESSPSAHAAALASVLQNGSAASVGAGAGATSSSPVFNRAASPYNSSNSGSSSPVLNMAPAAAVSNVIHQNFSSSSPSSGSSGSSSPVFAAPSAASSVLHQNASALHQQQQQGHLPLPQQQLPQQAQHFDLAQHNLAQQHAALAAAAQQLGAAGLDPRVALAAAASLPQFQPLQNRLQMQNALAAAAAAAAARQQDPPGASFFQLAGMAQVPPPNFPF